MKKHTKIVPRIAAFTLSGALPLMLLMASAALTASPQIPMSQALREQAINATCERRGGGLVWPVQGAPSCGGAHESLDDFMRRTGYNPAMEPAPDDPRSIETCHARGGNVTNIIGIPARTECQGAREFFTEQQARLGGMQQSPPPSAPSGERLHQVEAGAPQAGGQAISGPGVQQGAADTPPPPNPGVSGLGIAAVVAGGALAALAIGSAVDSVDYGDGGGGGTCYLRSCLKSSISGSCSCQEFDSAELCQFSETAPGGQCGDQNGFTTALCPSGYSCVNNTCRNDC